MDQHEAELSTLYVEVGPAIWSYLRRRARNRDTAEDLFQETFAAAASNSAALKTAASPQAWLIGIARNLLRERARFAGRRQAVLLPLDWPAEAPPAVDPRVEGMRAAIARLPAAQREVLELRLHQELTYAEIADVLSIPVGTVRSRLHGAVATLRAWATEAAAQGVFET